MLAEVIPDFSHSCQRLGMKQVKYHSYHLPNKMTV